MIVYLHPLQNITKKHSYYHACDNYATPAFTFRTLSIPLITARNTIATLTIEKVVTEHFDRRIFARKQKISPIYSPFLQNTLQKYNSKKRSAAKC